MQYRKFGNTDLLVSEIGFGAWAIGGGAMIGTTSIGWGDADDKVSVKAIHAAMDAGINFFDTADIYGLGHSETLLGKAIGKNKEILIASKAGKVGIGTNTPLSSLHLRTGQSATLISHGYLLIGNNTGTNLVFDDNDIQARNNGAAATLNLNYNGGKVQVGHSFSPQLWFENNEIQGALAGNEFELALQPDGNPVRIGPANGLYMQLDNNTIQARSNGAVTKLAINQAGGTVQIGVAAVPTGFLLSVDGKVICEELQVKLSGDWADYVFAKNYKLLSLEEVEQYIGQHQHLPNIPAAKLIEEKGLAIGDMQKLQMEKIEELTLYMIELNKQVKELKTENEKMRTRIIELEKK